MYFVGYSSSVVQLWRGIPREVYRELVTGGRSRMVYQEVSSLGGGIGTEAASRGTYVCTLVSSVGPYEGHIGTSIFVISMVSFFGMPFSRGSTFPWHSEGSCYREKRLPTSNCNSFRSSNAINPKKIQNT